MSVIIFVNGLVSKLGKLPVWKFIGLMFFLMIASLIPLMLIIELFGLDCEPEVAFHNDGILSEIIVLGAIIPIVETYFLQYLPIYLIGKFVTKNVIVLIVVPAFIFGLLHHYDVTYVIFATLGGLVLCTGFCAYYYNRGYWVAFWSVAVVHALRNILAIFTYYLDQ